MLLFLLGLIDVLAALLAMYTINFGALALLSTFFLAIILIKGIWSVLSYFGLMGLLDIVAPLAAIISISTGIFPVLSYILLILLMLKGLWSIFSYLH